MALDKRLPAVYVDIEDRSYVSTTTEIGRTGYVVLVSDRGPHNQVVELNSRQDLYDIFGEPNFAKYGQGHYFADQHLKRSNKLFVVRPVKLKENAADKNGSSIANCILRLNKFENTSKHIPIGDSPDNNFELIKGDNQVYLTNPNDVPAKFATVTFELNSSSIKVNDFIEYELSSAPGVTHTLTIKDSTDFANLTNPSVGLFDTYVIAKLDTSTNIITMTLLGDPSDISNPSYGALKATSFISAKLTILPIPGYSGSPITGAVFTSGINNSFQVGGGYIDDDITLGDEFWNISQDPTGGISFIVLKPQIVVDNTNINQIKSATGWTDTVTNLNIRADPTGIYITALGAGVFDVSTMITPTISKSEFYYINHAKPIEIGTSTNNPWVDTIPGKSPGNFTDFHVGDIIFPSGDTSKVYTVISADDKAVLLDSPVINSYRGEFLKFISIETEYNDSLTDPKKLDVLDTEILWYFNVIGTGKYYNNLFIKGVRNTVYERMYVDNNGDPEYPYAFMDIAIYRDNGDNTTTLLEGPWTVSLIEKTSKDIIIRDVYTGIQMYLPSVINRKSKIIRVTESRGVDPVTTMITDKNKISLPYQPDVEKRIIIQNLISGKLDNYSFGIKLNGGSDGDMFDDMGRAVRENVLPLLIKAYNGSLISTDGSIEKLLATIYPWYLLDYIYCGGWNYKVNYAAKELADLRQDCLLLTDTGGVWENHDEEMDARASYVPWNTWNAAFYTNYRTIYDAFTSKNILISPVYHAIDRHLYTDENYWIAEPVAGIEKGAIEEAIELYYSVNETQLADEIEKELNPVIIEPDGTYILQQFTTYKRLSVLKRQHVVKFVHYCKKQIPTLLKDILHRKATSFWINQAEARVKTFMDKFLDKGDTDRYAAITNYSVQCNFDEEASELNILLTIHPIRSIERINVSIIVT